MQKQTTGTMISNLAVKAALTVYEELPSGKKELDLKRYAKASFFYISQSS